MSSSVWTPRTWQKEFIHTNMQILSEFNLSFDDEVSVCASFEEESTFEMFVQHAQFLCQVLGVQTEEDMVDMIVDCDLTSSLTSNNDSIESITVIPTVPLQLEEDDFVCWYDCEPCDTESVPVVAEVANRSYASALKANVTLAQGVSKTGRMISDNIHLKPIRPFVLEEIRDLQSRVKVPSMVITKTRYVEERVPNEMLDQEILKFWENKSVGFGLGDYWFFEDGLVRKGKNGIRCQRCQGFGSKDHVLDQPCVCIGNKHNHNSSCIVPDDKSNYVRILSPGHRLGKTRWDFDFEHKKLPCGVASRLFVDAVNKNDQWIAEMLGMYGPHLFSFTTKGFEAAVTQLALFADRVGGIHPDIADCIARMVCRLPNKRVVFSKLVKKRVSSDEVTVVKDVSVQVKFRHPLVLKNSEPFSVWRKRQVPITDTFPQGDEFEVGQLPDLLEVVRSEPIQIPCTSHQAAISREARLVRVNEPFMCYLCGVSCNSERMLNAHLHGKQHAKKSQFEQRRLFECTYCKVICPNRYSYNEHLEGEQHRKTIRYFSTNAQGIFSQVLEVGKDAVSTVRVIEQAVYDGFEDCWFFQKVWELAGGEGPVPSCDRMFYCQVIPFLLREATLNNMWHLEYLYLGLSHMLSPPTKTLYLWVSMLYAAYYFLCKKEDVKETSAQGVGDVMTGVFKTIIPGFDLSDDEKKKIGIDLRNHAMARQALRDFTTFAKTAVEWIVSWLHHMLVETPINIKQWLVKVDAIDEVLLADDNSATTMKVRMAKYHEVRREIYQMLQQGKDLRRQLEVIEKDKFSLKIVNDRIKKLEAIISKNAGSFVGAEGKLKPHVIYFWGEPKTGKTTMVDHFYSDLFELLEEPAYNPAIDRYTINPSTPYHDTYRYNRLVDMQDVFQMKSSEIRETELYDLIHMADESPFPLNIAECGGKGSVYFCSEHIVVSSNFDMRGHGRDVTSLVTSMDAVIRRFDLYVEVIRNDTGTSGYDRSQMTFKIDGVAYSWDEFLLLAAKSVLKTRERSMGVTCLNKPPEVSARIAALRERMNVTHAQGFDFAYKDRLLKRLEELEESCRLSSFERAFTWIGSMRPFSAALPYNGWEMTVIRMRAKFVPIITMLARFVINWAEMIAGGMAMLAAWKLFSPKHTSMFEGMPGRSGGESEFRVRSKQNRKVPAKNQSARHRIAFGEGATTQVEGSLASNMSQVRQSCTKNLGFFKGGRCAMHYFGVFDRVICVPQHAFIDPFRDNCTLKVHGFLLNISLAELDPTKILLIEESHLVFIDISCYLKGYPPFADIRRRISPATKMEYHEAVLYTTRGGINDSTHYAVPISDVHFLGGKLRIKMKNEQMYMIESGIEGRGYSEVGDCGAPWVLDHPTGALVIGIHIGGTVDKKMHCTAVDRVMIDSVANYFKYQHQAPVEIVPHGTEYDPPEKVNTVEVLGVTDEVQWFIPRTSKLEHSLLHGIRPAVTAPAKLSPFLIEQEGVMVKVSPLVLNFSKNFVSKTYMEPSLTGAARELLEEYYFPLPVDTDTKILTIHEAIFGDPSDIFNKSINPQASIGWPWCERFSNRRELISLQKQTVHEMLVQACQRLMDGSKEQFLFIDMLKDERLPLEKVKIGKTRVFTVLPLHLNLVLKQLFGSFVMYLQRNKDATPVKVGVAQTPDDWGKLWNYVNNGGDFIAGDYSAFDKVLHFELVMEAVEIANRFYGDEYQDLRRDLIQRIFCAYHYVDGVVYQTYGGMPSGCYLTAVFNSLVNALYWYAFLYDSGEDLTDHKDWFKVATFGDDHLAAVRDKPKINQVTFGKWIGTFGLSYTTATKGTIEAPYTERDEVTFLKRKFRTEKGYVWAPMPEENLFEMIQWYRRSQASKSSTPQQIADDLLYGFELEAVHHGKEAYVRMQKEILDYYHTKNKRTFEQARAVLLAPSFNSQFTTMNGQSNYLQTLYEEPSCEEVFNCVKVSQSTGDIAITQAQGDDPPHTVETFLGNTEEVIVTKGLTKFVDQVEPTDDTSNQSVSPVVDDYFKIAPGYFNMCKRWLKIGNVTLGTADPTGYPVLRIDPLNALMRESHISTKISSVSFIRYVLEIQIKVISTKFHYGSVMCVWRPYYGAGMLRMGYVQIDTVANYGHWWIEPPPTAERDGPYDNIHTASQCEHSILSITARNTVNMEITWQLPYQYVPAEQMLAPRFHPGYLDLYNLTPIGPSNLDKPEILVFAAFKEIEGWGYKSYSNPTSIRRCKYLKYADLADLTKASDWNVPPPTGISMELNAVQSVWKKIAASSIETYDTLAQGMVDTVKEAQQQSTGSWFLDAAHWILDTSKTILTLFTPLGPILGFFGLSRPVDITPTTRMLQTGLPMSNALGSDICMSTAFNPANLCESDSSPTDKLITTIAGKMTYLGYFVFENVSDSYTLDFSPDYIKTYDDRVIMTPASYIVSKFRYWRSNIRFNFRFFSSSFVSGRFAVYIQYRFRGAQQGLCPTKIVDVSGDTEADIDIPFLYHAPWYDGFSGDLAGLYNVTVEALTDMVSDEAATVSEKPIYCTVWVSFPGLQVAGPSTVEYNNSTLMPLPRIGNTVSVTLAQGVETDAQGEEVDTDLPGMDPHPGMNVMWGMTDVPASIFHMAKRYAPAFGMKLKPLLGTRSFAKQSGAPDDHNVIVNDGPFYMYYGALYRFFRTSVNCIANTKMICDNTNSYGEHFRDGSTTNNWSAISPFVYNPKNMCQTRIPFRANVSYVPTPMGMYYFNVTYSEAEGLKFDGLPDWSNPNDTFIPKIQVNGVSTNPPKQLYVGAADDLCYRTYIGTPVCIMFDGAAYLNKFDESTDSANTVVNIDGQPIGVRNTPGPGFR
nr:polyprotein [Mute swan feces associated picorna-like virus 3]